MTNPSVNALEIQSVVESWLTKYEAMKIISCSWWQFLNTILTTVDQNRFVIWRLFLHHCQLQLNNVKNFKICPPHFEIEKCQISKLGRDCKTCCFCNRSFSLCIAGNYLVYYSTTVRWRWGSRRCFISRTNSTFVIRKAGRTRSCSFVMMPWLLLEDLQ